MMREGTDKRSADVLNNDLALLGSTITFGVGTENGRADFQSLTHSFDNTLSIMMDMMLHSTYPAPALERLRVHVETACHCPHFVRVSQKTCRHLLISLLV